MDTLCIDTSTLTSFVAIGRGGEISYQSTRSLSQHSQQLMPQVSEALTAVDCALKDLDAIAVGLGPGSFTALRVGMATVKGLAIGADLPVIGHSSLEVELHLLRQLYPQDVIVLVTDARRSEVFVRLSWPGSLSSKGEGGNILAERVLAPSALGALVIEAVTQRLDLCSRIGSLDVTMSSNPFKTLRIVGSGVDIYRKEIRDSMDILTDDDVMKRYDIVVACDAVNMLSHSQSRDNDGNLAVGLYHLTQSEMDRRSCDVGALACDSLAALAPTYIRSPEIRVSPR